MTGTPNGAGIPDFPMYGEGSLEQDLNITGLGTQIKDPAANLRCTWWEKAFYF
jgi:hypothetical protein